MIIITGVDNTGKSSLATHLSNKFGLGIIERYHTLPPQDYEDWYRFLVSNLDSDNPGIADRFYLDELVYGPVVRGKVGLTDHQIKMMNILIEEEDPLIILCHRSPERIIETFGDRKQYPSVEQVAELQQAYFQLVEKNPFRERTIGFCFDNDPHYENLDFMVKMYLEGRFKK